MQKILYIYGYGSNPKDSSTMKVCKEIMKELGYELVSYEYDQYEPNEGLNDLEDFINENNIKHVIGHSLGGFLTLCLNSNVKKLIINPCMKPQFELPKLGKVSPGMLYDYEALEEWLKSGDDTPWVSQTDEVMGLFGNNDELFSYYESFKKRYPRSYKFNSTHRPTIESFTEDIKTKIKEFFG
jgi:predicted esterase YcpF (UPF0227 family)